MSSKIIGTLLKFVPKNYLSYCVGKLVAVEWPDPFRLWLMKWFARRYQIDLNEAEKPLEEYQSIADLFTRHLKPGLRPIAEAPVVHPVDGTLSMVGEIRNGGLIQAKGKEYTLAELLGASPEEPWLQNFEGGTFLTYYLCPTDYHRVHSPVAGGVVSCQHIPGALWPVNPWAVQSIDKLFAVNERVVFWIKAADQWLGLVMVGATNVGKISVAFDSELVTNQRPRRSQIQSKSYEPPVSLEKGSEIGAFNMGSSVVVVAPKGFLAMAPTAPLPVQMGTAVNLHS